MFFLLLLNTVFKQLYFICVYFSTFQIIMFYLSNRFKTSFYFKFQNHPNAYSLKVIRQLFVCLKMANEVTHGKLVVCAIDFGTTFSGYAFQLTSDFIKDPISNIKTNQVWNAGGAALMSLKAPTCLLLEKNGTFVAFGYDAENQYTNLALDNEHHDYLFFRRFKMLLHRNPVSTKLLITLKRKIYHFKC